MRLFHIKKSVKGFTLVEVMVAMAIVALSISALLFSTGKQIENSSWLREKILAQWVALNILQDAQLQARVTEKFPEEKSSGDTKLADRQWQWEIQSSETNDKEIVRLDVNVYAGDNRNGDPVASASGYIDKYHKLKTVTSSRNRDNNENNDAFGDDTIDNSAIDENISNEDQEYIEQEAPTDFTPPEMGNYENGEMQQ